MLLIFSKHGISDTGVNMSVMGDLYFLYIHDDICYLFSYSRDKEITMKYVALVSLFHDDGTISSEEVLVSPDKEHVNAYVKCFNHFTHRHIALDPKCKRSNEWAMPFLKLEDGRYATI